VTSEVSEIQQLIDEIRDFADARDWGRFHSPKNLSMAVAGEAGELVAEFQWFTNEESFASALTNEKLEAIELEIADVAIYLLRLADVLELDLADAIRKKMQINGERF
jgi:dCTP diphosphatase